nr:putative ribonuclease H-like domain-containing protein [Tanacetum cinerariifolium]
MKKLVRHNLVRGLPTKSFDNDHTCTACLKGKQHKAFCKSKLVNSVTKPLYTLHMDLFGPTSVSSISHKWYCLVVTDDFSRFTWTFFLRSKDETSDILKKFITEIENLKDYKVKIIRIHKDHPKSQVIDPVDTPIQTRHKSKMVEEQSFMATIHQKTDPALLQFCLFLCFLSQVEPKKVSDALGQTHWDKMGSQEQEG